MKSSRPETKADKPFSEVQDTHSISRSTTQTTCSFQSAAFAQPPALPALSRPMPYPRIPPFPQSADPSARRDGKPEKDIPTYSQKAIPPSAPHPFPDGSQHRTAPASPRYPPWKNASPHRNRRQYSTDCSVHDSHEGSFSAVYCAHHRRRRESLTER